MERRRQRQEWELEFCVCVYLLKFRVLYRQCQCQRARAVTVTLLHPVPFHPPNTHYDMDSAILSTSSEFEQKVSRIFGCEQSVIHYILISLYIHLYMYLSPLYNYTFTLHLIVHSDCHTITEFNSKPFS